MRLSRKTYIQCFGVIIVILAILRQTCPGIANDNKTVLSVASKSSKSRLQGDTPLKATSTQKDPNEYFDTSEERISKISNQKSRFFDAKGQLVKSRIFSVPNFGDAFPDQNDIQLIAAQRYGVKAVVDRADAEHRKSELVYVGSNPFYHIDKLKSSIPYLVPRAAELLQDIGRSFFDSLQVKQIPLHKIIVTSVLRSKADVARLRSHNGNATQNSCHLYGTTFDICYNRYKTVEDPTGPKLRQVRNDSLKWVLSEVLNDKRKNNRCYIKYEVKQGCFHITVN